MYWAKYFFPFDRKSFARHFNLFPFFFVGNAGEGGFREALFFTSNEICAVWCSYM